MALEHAELTKAIIGAFFKVFNQLGHGYSEKILNYLKCAGGGVGLLVNFGDEVAYHRYVMGRPGANLPNLI